MKAVRSSEITPEGVYMSRRRFMTGAAKLLAGAAILSACGGQVGRIPAPGDDGPAPPVDGRTDELGNALTPYAAVTGYNNYYEFSLNKEAVAGLAAGFPTADWAVTVGGLVERPQTFDLDDLRAFEAEERILRMRCVEGWSMVIPWTGFPLARLLREVEPQSSARYVRFETALDERAMPGLRQPFPWPYVEGLRLDEALHDLTTLATGVYGQDLPPQNGVPVRLVVPWKYGVKSLKSIVKIDLVAEMPTTFWMAAGAGDYGFWSNVNPEVPHRRWSQATERLIGENVRKETLFLNGYADDVAGLYDDLSSPSWYF